MFHNQCHFLLRSFSKQLQLHCQSVQVTSHCHCNIHCIMCWPEMCPHRPGGGPGQVPAAGRGQWPVPGSGGPPQEGPGLQGSDNIAWTGHTTGNQPGSQGDHHHDDFMFVTVSSCCQEVEMKQDQSYTMQTNHNIYLTKEDWDRSRSKEHVCNQRLDTKVAALSCDLLQEDGPLKIIFKSNSFLRFIQKILNIPTIYRNVDPIGAVFVNIYKVKLIADTILLYNFLKSI